MLTNKEIIQRVLSTDKVQTKENKITKRYVFNVLSTIRSILLTQQLFKKISLPIDSYQLLPCIELEKAPLSECNCIPSTLLPHISVYRSIKKIPSILKNTVSDITTIDGEVRLDIINYSALKYSASRKYGKQKPFIFFFNNYIWLINAEYELLQMRAIFMRPEEVYEFNYCGCDIPEDCQSYLDKDFPMSEQFVDTLIAMSKESVFNAPKEVPQEQKQQ